VEASTRSDCAGATPLLLLVLFAGCFEAIPASAGSLQPALQPDVVVAAAGTYAGWPYRFGGNSVRGLDCSALVQRAFRAAGLELPRTAAEQFRRGYAVVRQELAAGDLVFFRGARRLSKTIVHVGIYIGGGRFIHASRHGVITASLNAAHWVRRFAGARRVIEAAPAALLEGPLCVDGGKSP
jgi:cell wall-associated NlpC family hydrolase